MLHTSKQLATNSVTADIPGVGQGTLLYCCKRQPRPLLRIFRCGNRLSQPRLCNPPTTGHKPCGSHVWEKWECTVQIRVVLTTHTTGRAPKSHALRQQSAASGSVPGLGNLDWGLPPEGARGPPSSDEAIEKASKKVPKPLRRQRNTTGPRTKAHPETGT